MGLIWGFQAIFAVFLLLIAAVFTAVSVVGYVSLIRHKVRSQAFRIVIYCLAPVLIAMSVLFVYLALTMKTFEDHSVPGLLGGVLAEIFFNDDAAFYTILALVLMLLYFAALAVSIVIAVRSLIKRGRLRREENPDAQRIKKLKTRSIVFFIIGGVLLIVPEAWTYIIRPLI